VTSNQLYIYNFRANIGGTGSQSDVTVNTVASLTRNSTVAENMSLSYIISWIF